jgi:hypothetical protein
VSHVLYLVTLHSGTELLLPLIAREGEELMQTSRIERLNDNVVSSVRASWSKSIDIGKCRVDEAVNKHRTRGRGESRCIKLLLFSRCSSTAQAEALDIRSKLQLQRASDRLNCGFYPRAPRNTSKMLFQNAIFTLLASLSLVVAFPGYTYAPPPPPAASTCSAGMLSIKTS